MDLVILWPGYTEKALLSPAQHGTLLRPHQGIQEGSKVGHRHMDTGTTLFSSQQSTIICHEPSGFFTGHTSLLKAQWAGPTISAPCSSWMFILSPYRPEQFILFICHHST